MYNSVIVRLFSNYWLDIVVILVALELLYLINKLLVKYDKNGKMKRILLALVVEAEKYLGSKTGELKKQQVITWFKERYPIISIFVTVDMLNKLIDNTVDVLNMYLSETGATLEGLDGDYINKIYLTDNK